MLNRAGLIGLSLLVLIFSGFVQAAGTSIEIVSDTPDGQLAVGQSITWTIKRSATAEGDLQYRLKQNNLKVLQEGDLKPADTEKTITARLDEPGWLYLEVTGERPGEKNPIASAGAIVGIEAVKPVVQRPDDFRAFWQSQIEAINKVPANAVVSVVNAVNVATTAPAEKKSRSKLYEITLDNVDGKQVHAQLAVPQRPGKFPVLVLYQYAGVYPLQPSWATLWADRGWLVLNVMAHDLPIYESREFYSKQSDGPLANYTEIGNASRETSYFRTMLTGDYQAIKYAAARAEADGKTLVVMGTSQGGLQAFAMAALFPGVTGLIATVPAGADTRASDGGRLPGWPYWYRMKSSDPAAVMKTSTYYDTINFAFDVKCPALVCVGARDTTAPPLGAISAFSVLAGPKELVLMPDATHQSNHGPGQSRVTAWMQAIRAGNAVPPAK